MQHNNAKNNSEQHNNTRHNNTTKQRKRFKVTRWNRENTAYKESKTTQGYKGEQRNTRMINNTTIQR